MFITPIVKYIDRHLTEKFDIIVTNSDQTAEQIRMICSGGREIERYSKKEAKEIETKRGDLKVFLSIF